MRVVVFTAIMVNDPLKDKPIDSPSHFERIAGWDYILLTNITNAYDVFKNSGWRKGEIRIMEPPKEEMPERTRKGWSIYAARWCKWHPDKLFSDYNIAIWVDGWQIPNPNKKEEWYNLIDNFWNKPSTFCILHDIHHKNQCIYEEHQDIIYCSKDTYVNMLKVTKYVKTMRCPTNLGLFWTGCYIYKIGSDRVQQVINNLWEDMLMYTYRDQALLMYEIWRNNAFDIWGAERLRDLISNVDTDTNHGYV